MLYVYIIHLLLYFLSTFVIKIKIVEAGRARQQPPSLYHITPYCRTTGVTVTLFGSCTGYTNKTFRYSTATLGFSHS